MVTATFPGRRHICRAGGTSSQPYAQQATELCSRAQVSPPCHSHLVVGEGWAGVSGAEEPGRSSDTWKQGAGRRQCDRGSWPAPHTLPPRTLPPPNTQLDQAAQPPLWRSGALGRELSAQQIVNTREVGQLWAEAPEAWHVSSTGSCQDAEGPGEETAGPRGGRGTVQEQASAQNHHQDGRPPGH